jgi:molecular chaperone Hsp33
MTMQSGAADLLRPFHLERSQLRGRAIRLASTVDYVLRAHEYPRAVSELLGELLTLAGALAGGLKFDGKFSLQVRGDGPVRLLTADCTNDGQMRGYAGYDADAITGHGDEPPLSLVGRGLLALTVDQRDTGGEAYQGVVELAGDTLSDCMRAYFERSEQLPTAIRIAVDREPQTGRWQAGAIVVQALPNTDPRKEVEADEDWRRAMVLLGTATDTELLDPALGPDDVLFRLFHEDGVRVWEPTDLNASCRCSRDRVATVLRSLPRDEIGDLKVNGRVEVTCEFCNSTYTFDDAQLDHIYG